MRPKNNNKNKTVPSFMEL